MTAADAIVAPSLVLTSLQTTCKEEFVTVQPPPGGPLSHDEARAMVSLLAHG